jgi:hypothetical protein
MPVACLIVVSRPEEAPLLYQVWPTFAAELAAALDAEGEDLLAERVGQLRVVETCGCGDNFCQGFYTAPRPAGAYGDGHRNICLDPPWPGQLILDVVDDHIAYVEVLYRVPLC